MDRLPLPGSSVHGILQTRIVEWIAIPFSRDLPDPGIEPGSPALQADSLPSELTRKIMAKNTSHKKKFRKVTTQKTAFTKAASKFGKLSSGHRTGKGQFSFQSQRKSVPKND